MHTNMCFAAVYHSVEKIIEKSLENKWFAIFPQKISIMASCLVWAMKSLSSRWLLEILFHTKTSFMARKIRSKSLSEDNVFPHWSLNWSQRHALILVSFHSLDYCIVLYFREQSISRFERVLLFIENIFKIYFWPRLLSDILAKIYPTMKGWQ